MSRRRRSILLFGVLALTVALWFVVPSLARTQQATKTTASHAAVATLHIHHGRVTNAERKAAAARAAALGLMPGGTAQGRAVARATGVPDYFGTIPNYANSPPPAGPIGRIRVTNGGSGYGASVTVQITDIVWGSGTGAKAKATVVNGRVTAITVTAGGQQLRRPQGHDRRQGSRRRRPGEPERRQAEGRHPQVRRCAAWPRRGWEERPRPVHPRRRRRHDDVPRVRLLRDRPGPVQGEAEPRPPGHDAAWLRAGRDGRERQCQQAHRADLSRRLADP